MTDDLIARLPERIHVWPSDVTPEGETALTGSWMATRYPEDAVEYVRAATLQAERDDLIARLRSFASGCRGSMWQSRDKTISLCDEAADTLTALQARAEKAEAEADKLRRALFGQGGQNPVRLDGTAYYPKEQT